MAEAEIGKCTSRRFITEGCSAEIKQQTRQSETCPRASCWGEREAHTHAEKEGEKESRELTDFSKGAGSLYHAQQLMYICLCILTRASAAPQRLISSHDASHREQFLSVFRNRGEENGIQISEKKLSVKSRKGRGGVRYCTGTLAKGKVVIRMHYVNWRINLPSTSVRLPFGQIVSATQHLPSGARDSY